MGNSAHRYNGTGFHIDKYINNIGKQNLKKEKPLYEPIRSSFYYKAIEEGNGSETKAQDMMYSQNRCIYQNALNENICLRNQYTLHCSQSIYCKEYIKGDKGSLKSDNNKPSYAEFKQKEKEIEKEKKRKLKEEKKLKEKKI